MHRTTRTSPTGSGCLRTTWRCSLTRWGRRFGLLSIVGVKCPSPQAIMQEICTVVCLVLSWQFPTNYRVSRVLLRLGCAVLGLGSLELEPRVAKREPKLRAQSPGNSDGDSLRLSQKLLRFLQLPSHKAPASPKPEASLHHLSLHLPKPRFSVGFVLGFRNFPEQNGHSICKCKCWGQAGWSGAESLRHKFS